MFHALYGARTSSHWLLCWRPRSARRLPPWPAASFYAADLLPASAPRIEAMPLPENRGAGGLYESLKRLDTTASLMMIVAHPDDEDGGMLTYESRGLGVRTALFTLTRGEGGQNAMSAADYDALGLIRTNELLRADEYYGVGQQYWGSVADYGFSKTMEEALAQWGHERVLYDAVRAVRMYRPMVVCSVFVGGVTDGHGHHQVAGMLAQEVFNAAGDPKVFPDQIAAGPSALEAAQGLCARARLLAVAKGHVRLRDRQIRAGALSRLREQHGHQRHSRNQSSRSKRASAIRCRARLISR